MASELTQRIQKNPQYQDLIKKRNTLGLWLTILVLVAYYGFILLIAFNKSLLAKPLIPGMITSWGIPAGFGIILLTIVVTTIYVRIANREYDRVIKEILDKEVQS